MRTLLLVLFLLGTRVWAEPSLTPLESEVIGEVNLLRTHPEQYRAILESDRPLYQGNLLRRPGKTTEMTHEGLAALEEAIDFLAHQRPLGSLAPSLGLTFAARDHVRDQGPTGGTGHAGSDGSQPMQRDSRYGRSSLTGENISYGMSTARDIVKQLLVDDGVGDRGHRKNLFGPDYQRIGVGFGPHTRFGVMCVMDLAGSYAEDSQAQAHRPPDPPPGASPRPAGSPGRPTGNAFQQARGVAEQHYAAAAGADRDSWAATFSRTRRAQLSSYWASARPTAAGASYAFSSSASVADQRMQLVFLRRSPQGTPSQPPQKAYITLILENGQWVVEEASY